MKIPLFSHNKKVIHSSYHKAGSYWVARIFADMCDRGKEKIAILEGGIVHMSGYPNARVFYDNNSCIIVDIPDCVGTHMIRDPRDIVISGYFYHQWTNETGYKMYSERLGMSYQQKLQELPQEEGILFEMQNKAAQTISEMRQWNYYDPRFLEIRYENLIADPPAVFTQMFQHWGITPDNLEECLAIAHANHMTQMTGRKVGEEQKGSHMRNGLPGQWKYYFSEAHKVYFKEKFGDILVLLGYEKGSDW